MGIAALILISALCYVEGNSLFDEKLYRNVVDPDLCEVQLQNMDRMEFYDSSFRAPQGLLRGNFLSLGNYHECLAINQNSPGSGIAGKYCLVRAELAAPTLRVPSLGGVSDYDNLTWTEWKLNWSREEMLRYSSVYNGINISNASVSSTKISSTPVLQSVALTLGVCVPKSCTADAVLRPYAEHPLVRFNYSQQFCRLPGDKPLGVADYSAFVILLLISLLTLLSSGYERHHTVVLKKDPADANKWFLVWSLVTNTRRLLTFPENPRALNCLDGIRSLSVLWIMSFHIFPFTRVLKLSVNKFEVVRELFGHKYLWFVTGPTAVDTFFVLSGLLLVYNAAYKMTQKGLLESLHLFYLNRYMRLFPLLGGALLLQTSVLHRVADGPLWSKGFTAMVVRCRTYWWSVLLHLQNIYNTSDICMTHTWYLSVDWQLFLVSPLVLYWTLGRPRAAWCALAAAVFCSLAATLAICFYYDFPSWDANQSSRLYDQYYKNTVTRSPPFFIGMLAGYVLHVCREKKVLLSRWSVFSGYFAALVSSFYAVYMLHPTMQVDWHNQVIVNLDNGLAGTAWALALCWLIIACSHGYGGPLNWFLSLKMWRLPARLSYSMYLYSFMVQHVRYSSSASLNDFNTQTMWSMFAADLFWSVVLAAAACVLIEEPVVRLYSLLLKQRTSSKKNSTV